MRFSIIVGCARQCREKMCFTTEVLINNIAVLQYLADFEPTGCCSSSTEHAFSSGIWCMIRTIGRRESFLNTHPLVQHTIISPPLPSLTSPRTHIGSNYHPNTTRCGLSMVRSYHTALRIRTRTRILSNADTNLSLYESVDIQLGHTTGS